MEDSTNFLHNANFSLPDDLHTRVPTLQHLCAVVIAECCRSQDLPDDYFVEASEVGTPHQSPFPLSCQHLHAYQCTRYFPQSTLKWNAWRCTDLVLFLSPPPTSHLLLLLNLHSPHRTTPQHSSFRQYTAVFGNWAR